MTNYIGAIDQGTTSSRFILFDKDGQIAQVDQREHEQITPQGRLGRARREGDLAPHAAGDRRRDGRLGRRGRRRRGDRHHQPARDDGGVGPRDRASRSTTRSSGRTRAPARSCASWPATRASTACATRSACRCRPTSPGRRSRWLLDNVDGARKRAENGELAFGTMDTWVLWNLTGGTKGGVHLTDVTNASRTMLMDLETLDWHEPSARADGHPALDAARDPLLERDLRRGGGHRDRRAADRRDPRRPARRRCSARRASTRATRRTPTAPARSCSSTPARRSCARTSCSPASATSSATAPASYVLEGSIAVTGALIQWLRDRLEDHRRRARGRGARARASTTTAASTSCPAFSGLFAPYWRDDARGVIVGLTAYANQGHIARAALEAAAWQSREVVDAANAVADVPVHRAARRRRHDRQRAADAVPGRRARRSRRPPGGDRDDRARRRLRGRPRGRLLVGPGRAARALVRRTSAGSPTWTRTSASAATRVEEGGRALARLGGGVGGQGDASR